jgi:hypothetical protein
VLVVTDIGGRRKKARPQKQPGEVRFGVLDQEYDPPADVICRGNISG